MKNLLFAIVAVLMVGCGAGPVDTQTAPVVDSYSGRMSTFGEFQADIGEDYLMIQVLCEELDSNVRYPVDFEITGGRLFVWECGPMQAVYVRVIR